MFFLFARNSFIYKLLRGFSLFGTRLVIIITNVIKDETEIRKEQYNVRYTILLRRKT
jgi:hypothetical protein